MSRHNHVFHHYVKSKKRLTTFDKVAIVAAFAYPLTGIPQVVEIINGNSSGVSLLSWVGFMAFSLLFFVYGFVHRVTPMIITNLLWLIIDSTIVILIVARSLVA